MAQRQGVSSSAGGRLDGSCCVNALSASTHITLGAGWGDGAVTKTLLTGSNDQRGQLTITSVGSNQAQATATVVITFADGAYASAPFAIVTTTNDNSIDTGKVAWTSTTTALTLTYSVAPVDTKIYKINWALIA